MPDVDLTFGYDLPLKVVYDWWTDLSGIGYVGKSLKSLRQIGKNEEGKILVKTKWKVMGMNMRMVERLTLDSLNHWVWEPHMLGIYITDNFHLDENESGSRLHIISEFHPKGMRGKLARKMLGGYLRKLMTEEWMSADRAFRTETTSNVAKSW
ncbi:MAG: hypothetical protein PXY39_06600 [archaeon]|nr:hypothetical protein [archaeon]